MDAFEAFYRAKIAQLERELRLAKSEVKRQLILRELKNYQTVPYISPCSESCDFLETTVIK